MGTFEARRSLLSAITRQPQLEAVLMGHNADEGGADALWFSSDGREVAARVRGNRIYLWSVDSDQPKRSELGATSDLRDIQLSADFGLFAGIGADAKTVYVRSRSAARPEVVIHQPAAVEEIALSPDGHIVATGSSDGIIELWSTTSGQRLGPPLTESNETHENGPNVIQLIYPVLALRFSPNGHQLYWTISPDEQGGFDLDTGQPLVRPVDAPPGELLISADRSTAVVTEGTGALTWAVVSEGKLQAKRQLVSQGGDPVKVAAITLASGALTSDDIAECYLIVGFILEDSWSPVECSTPLRGYRAKSDA
jgi:WD40 repeat protein